MTMKISPEFLKRTTNKAEQWAFPTARRPEFTREGLSAVNTHSSILALPDPVGMEEPTTHITHHEPQAKAGPWAFVFQWISSLYKEMNVCK
jgi:hypothetical protein